MAWELARENVKRAQKQQKRQYDRHARPKDFKPGDRVFVYMPGAKRGKAYKFAQAFHGPYRILEVVDNGVMVRPVDRPRAKAIRVALNRVRVCPKFLPDKSWPPSRTAKSKEQSSHVNEAAEGSAGNFSIPQPPGAWSGRLRSHTRRGRPES